MNTLRHLALATAMVGLGWPLSKAQMPPPPAPALIANPALSLPLADCIAELRRDLRVHAEVRADTFDRYTREVQDLRPVIDGASRSQPEFELPIWDYLARLADAQRAAQGTELMVREAAALEVVAKRHDVEPAIAVAVFGVETDYGRVAGRYPVVDATLSRACLNLKSDERRQHFFAALRLLQEGVVKPEQFKGSWAGAFGMTQFMPGTFVRYMSDGDGAPPADIVNSAGDALVTTARYLKSLGWRGGVPWGIEVRVPKPLADANALQGDHACLTASAAAGKCRSVAQWMEAGVTRFGGASLLTTTPSTIELASSSSTGSNAAGIASRDAFVATTRTALLMPSGIDGPAWLVTANYQAIWRYNRADAYALAIGLLADRLRGVPAPRTPWPTDDPGLSRAEFTELQALLRARGHCDVKADGADGPRTRAAIVDEEARAGRASTGRGGGRLLGEMRKTSAGTATNCAGPVVVETSAATAR